MATESKLNLNRPCNACRRRKVRCDKTQPCTNCAKHGWTCIYDPDGGSTSAAGGDQSVLYERIDRLERMIEDMSAVSFTDARSRRLAMERDMRNESGPAAPPPAGPENQGIQVFEPNTSYFMGPNFWMNLHEFIYEPRYLLRVEYDDSYANSWPFLSPTPPNLIHMHLPPEKEDQLVEFFYELVEPFIKITHRPSFKGDLLDFRRGESQIEREFEALFFCVQLLTVMAMPSVLVQRTIGQSRKDLMAHLRRASEMALSRANVLQSRKVVMFQAILCYITYLFFTCQSEVANTMLGLAARIGMRMGLHRDPKHYNFSPGTAEMRRRMWNHFMLMDSQLFTGEGSDSGLGMATDVGRSTNANDDEWMPTRFMQHGSGPVDRDGFTEMTFVILRDEILNTMRKWARMKASGESPEVLSRMLDETEQFLTKKFLSNIDESKPIQLVAEARFKAHYGYVRLFIQFNAARSSRQSNIAQQATLFRHSIEMLEWLDRSETVAKQHNWGWLYNWPVPFSALAFTLTGLVHQLDHPDIDRAWKQVEVCFRRHMNSEVQIHHLPAWHAVERLCDQAMYYHPDRIHTGNAYTQRGESPRSSQSPPSVGQNLATTAPPVGPESFLGDMGLFSHMDADLAMSHMFHAAGGPAITRGSGMPNPESQDTLMFQSNWPPPPPPPPPPPQGGGFPPQHGFR